MGIAMGDREGCGGGVTVNARCPSPCADVGSKAMPFKDVTPVTLANDPVCHCSQVGAAALIGTGARAKRAASNIATGARIPPRVLSVGLYFNVRVEKVVDSACGLQARHDPCLSENAGTRLAR
jgi:hypothetical protein